MVASSEKSDVFVQISATAGTRKNITNRVEKGLPKDCFRKNLAVFAWLLSVHGMIGQDIKVCLVCSGNEAFFLPNFIATAQEAHDICVDHDTRLARIDTIADFEKVQHLAGSAPFR